MSRSSATASRPELEIGRFRVIATIGEGAHGVVYHAVDTRDGTPVALKVLRRWHPRALSQFKREFRAVVGIAHPNVVRLSELFESGGDWFFTMELVEGLDPRDHASDGAGTLTGAAGRGALTPATVERIRAMLRQLGEGLAVLHAAGRVHRDVKPSNMRVTAQGRLVLLDFGVASANHTQTLQDERLVGTMAYMAPEQARGEHVGSAADMYAVGVVLFELLTSTLPFTGGPVDMALAKQRTTPPPPSSVVSGVPADLDALCVELLSIDPATRPTALTLAHHGTERAAHDVARDDGGRGVDLHPIVGRDAELAMLDRALKDALSDRFAFVSVRGDAGIGKTRLLDVFAEDVVRQRPDAWVIRARSDRRERVPYNAFDAAIDALARRLVRGPPLEGVPGAGALTLLFPALAQVSWLSRARPASDGSSAPLATEARQALMELLREVSRKSPLVLLLDDFDGADAESVELFTALVSAPAAPSMVVVTASVPLPAAPDVVRDALARASAADGAAVVELGNLSPDAATRVAAARLAERGITETLAPQLARQSGGNPGFVARLAAFCATSERPTPDLDALFEQELGAHSPECGRMLALAALAVDEEPGTCVAILNDAGAVPEAIAGRAIAALRSSPLGRVREGQHSTTLHIVHPRVSSFLLRRLTDAERRRGHAALAGALMSAGSANTAVIAEHWHRAGEPERAASLFDAAAEASAAAGDTSRAVALYRRALGADTADADAAERDDARCRGRRTKLADALSASGQQEQAAAEYRRAARDAPHAESVELRRRAVDLLLRHGNLHEGVELAQELLGAIGSRWSATPGAALASAVWERTRLRLRGLSFLERAPVAADAERLLACDVLWTLATSFGVTDVLRSAELHTRALRLALDLGEPRRLARSLALEGIHGNGDLLRSRGVLSRAESLALKNDDPRGLAFTKFAAAYQHSEVAEEAEAVKKAEEAVMLLLEHCPGAWELGPARTLAIASRGALGRFGDLGRRYEVAREEARARGDRCALMVLEMSRLFVDMPADRPDQCQAAIERVVNDWPVSAQMPRIYATLALVVLDLYRGGAAAHLRIERDWSRLESSMAYRMLRFRIQLISQRGLAALAALAESKQRDRTLVKVVERCATLLRKENFVDTRATAHLLAGQLDVLRDERESAANHYREAVVLYSSLGLCASRVAGERLSVLVGGAEGAAHVASNEAWARDERVVAPDKFYRAFAPVRV